MPQFKHKCSKCMLTHTVAHVNNTGYTEEPMHQTAVEIASHVFKYMHSLLMPHTSSTDFKTLVTLITYNYSYGSFAVS